MPINHKSKIPGYNNKEWFSIEDTTNIISLKNLTEQYSVTYNKNDQIFIVQRE